MAIAKLKIGDKVKVIAGKDKGKESEIIAVNREKNTVTLKGINMMTKHQKAVRGKEAGIVEKEAPINASNVMLLVNGKTTRVGVRVLKDEKTGKVEKVRYAKSTGDNI